MHTKHESTKNLLRILGLSLLIHGGGLLAYLAFLDRPDTPQDQVERTVQVTLSSPQTPPAPKKEQLPAIEQSADKPIEIEEQHLPTHNADEFASQNQDNPEQDKIKAGGGVQSQTTDLVERHDQKGQSEAQEGNQETQVAERDAKETSEQLSTTQDYQEIIATAGQSLYEVANNVDEQEGGSVLAEQNGGGDRFKLEEMPRPEELAIPREMLDTLGNLELLSDNELSETVVEHPFSEKKAKELKLVNRYLERMTKQVHEFWINPYQGREKLKGIIKLELNVAGFVEHAYVFRSSGDRLLDISVLDAIRAVPRFEVPENPVITQRYYTNLSFFYSSIQDETELMPFEEGYADTRNTN